MQKKNQLLISSFLISSVLNLWIVSFQDPSPSQKNIFYLDSQLVKRVACGFTSLIVDWNLISALIQVDKDNSSTGERFLFMADLDPAFQEIYESGANLLIVVRKDPASAEALLLKGQDFIQNQLSSYPSYFRESYWGRAWMIYVLMAYVQTYEKQDLPKGLEAFQKASTFTGAPGYVGYLSEKMQKKEGVYEVGIRLLDLLLGGATNAKNEKSDRETCPAASYSLS